MSAWTDLWGKVKLLFSNVFSYVWPMVQKFLTDEGTTILGSAYNICVDIQNTMPEATWEAKRQEAFNRLTTLVTSQGMQIAVTFLLDAIQLVVNKLQASATTTTEAKAISNAWNHIIPPPPSEMWAAIVQAAETKPSEPIQTVQP